MDECGLITFVTAIACSISKCSTEEEIELMAAVFVQLGDTLATVLVQKARQNNKDNVIDQNNNDINKDTNTNTNPNDADSNNQCSKKLSYPANSFVE